MPEKIARRRGKSEKRFFAAALVAPLCADLGRPGLPRDVFSGLQLAI